MNKIPLTIWKYIKNKTVLDVGCGSLISGWHSSVASCSKATGLDINKNITIELEEAGYDIIREDITNLCLDIGKFEVVLCGETIEHVENQSFFIEGLKRHCKSEGLIIITTPNANSLANTIYTFLRIKLPETSEHVIAHRKTTLTNLLREHDLKVIKTFYFNKKPDLNKRKGFKKVAVFFFELILSIGIKINKRNGLVLGIICKRNKKYKK